MAKRRRAAEAYRAWLHKADEDGRSRIVKVRGKDSRSNDLIEMI